MAERLEGGPRSVIVVGAGIVGLSTAWFLQERGVTVTVVDRTGIAAGASWGNAGWLAPGLAIPLNGVRWDERRDLWVGPRPVTPDGRPLVGALRAPNLYVAGGHGMWGLAHGPVTGRLLAEQITTGKQPTALRALDPLRTNLH